MSKNVEIVYDKVMITDGLVGANRTDLLIRREGRRLLWIFHVLLMLTWPKRSLRKYRENKVSCLEERGGKDMGWRVSGSSCCSWGAWFRIKGYRKIYEAIAGEH